MLGRSVHRVRLQLPDGGRLRGGGRGECHREAPPGGGWGRGEVSEEGGRRSVFFVFFQLFVSELGTFGIY